MGRDTTFLWLVALVTASGCSVVFDGDEYKGGAPGDGGTGDGQVSDNPPTTPEIAIAPEAPRTDDDLQVTIVTESTDPLGEAEVVYEYVWSVGDQAADIAGPVVGGDETTKGETWQVQVTPVAGERRGVPAEASVTVVNSPPEIVSLGLTSYLPRLDDRVQVYATAFVDADGDPVTASYQWMANEMPIEDATNDTLRPDERGVTLEDTLSVVVTPNDGEEDGPSATAGPVPIDTMSRPVWRQLLPDRFPDSESLVFWVHDRANRRAVYWVGNQLWEYSLTPNRTGWARLYPDGEPPPFLFASRAIYDEERQRMLVIGGATVDEVFNRDLYALDLTRGAESWSRITPGGDDPGARLWPSLFVEEEQDRLFMFGTIPFEGEIAPNNELWTLDLENDQWSQIDLTTMPQNLVGSGWIHSPETNEAFLLGGALWDTTTGNAAEIRDDVWVLDLTPGEEDFTQSTMPLPTPLAFPTTAYDPVGQRGIILHGSSSIEIDVGNETVYQLDVATREITELAIDGPPSQPSFLESMHYEELGERFVHLGGLLDGSWQASVSTLSLSGGDGEWEALDVPWVTGPGPLAEAGGWQEGESFIVVGGRDQRRRARGEAFRYDFRAGKFTPIEIEADPNGNGRPEPTWGWGSYSGDQVGKNGDSVFFFGGRRDRDTLAPSEVWSIETPRRGDYQWIFHELTGGRTPDPQEGWILSPDCRSSRLLVWGLDQAGDVGGPLTRLLECTTQTVCSFQNVPNMVPVRRYAPASEWLGEPLVFGGVDQDGTARNQLLHANQCNGGEVAVTDVTRSLRRPQARRSHTFTRYRDDERRTRWLVAGGRSVLQGGGATFRDVWEITANEWAWTQIVPNADARHPEPAERFGHAAAYDSVPDRLVVFGGDASRGVNNELWELLLE